MASLKRYIKIRFQEIKRQKLAYLFILPTLLGVFLITIYPLFRSIWFSFHKYYIIELKKGVPFIGLDNYRYILYDPLFWLSFKNTVIFTFGCVLITMLIGLGVALLLNQNFRGRNFVAVTILLPWVIPKVAASILWKWIYDDQYGILNYFLCGLGFQGFSGYGWLINSATSLLAVMVVVIWQSFPFVAIALLAGLQTIPKTLYEAADVDGASSWQKFRYISLPMLKHLITILLILSTIWDFKVFDQMYVLTRGGPANSTMILGIYTWMMAFGSLRMGRAAALAIIMFLILMMATIFYLMIIRKEEGIS